MSAVSLILPHQLFADHPALDLQRPVILIEESLLFTQYPFHKQKLVMMRAAMRHYRQELLAKGFDVRYIQAHEPSGDVRKCLHAEAMAGCTEVHLVDPVDNWLEKRIKSAAKDMALHWYDSPSFLNTKRDLATFFKPSKKKFFQTAFYKAERIKRGVLMDGDSPMGGQWTFDADNRKRFPKDRNPPEISWPEKTVHHQEAEDYVQKYFGENLGQISENIVFPIDHKTAGDWLDQFLSHRFEYFGHYEDALVDRELLLHHSLLSPLLNMGLLTPEKVLDRVIGFAQSHNIPLNSTEGLVRQIMGWREFIRGVYQTKGTQERTTNFWQHKRRIPKSFYEGTTGLYPVDSVIEKVKKTAYAHHIERLMVLGNIMVLCEFDPDEVYRWFMELFIDAFDWVMVPNVYGMSLFADGGLMSTKPYISGSNYLMKMSDYPKGPWQDIWDGLFWRFMDKHRDFFLKNPRLSMLVRSLDKMKPETLERHLLNAQNFLDGLDAELSAATIKN